MRLVFFDLETGGFDSSKHPIIQIAAVAVDEHLDILEEFERKIAFEISSADPQALLNNSFDREVWDREGWPDLHVANELSRFLKRYADVEMISQRSGKPYNVAQLIGHNADKFDAPFLQAWYKRLEQLLPASFSVFCTYQRAMHHFHEHPKLKRPEDLKLGTLCKHYGIVLDRAHDALADVRANIAVYRRIREQAETCR